MMKRWTIRALVMGASLLIGVVLAVVADGICGYLLPKDRADLVFPAFSRAHHQSSEFDVMVRINNLGFRGANVARAKHKKRVVVLGDSFAFGWGVDVDCTWIAQLEREFPDMEWLNLGQGGTHPGDQVQLARKAIPLLQPDLVIASVLQGNDMHQLMRAIAYQRGEHSVALPQSVAAEKPEARYMPYLRRLLPHLAMRFARPVQIGERWNQEAKAILASFSPQHRTRYAQLPAPVRTAFEAAMLNPSLLFEAMHHPNAPCAAADTTLPLTHDAMMRLRDHMAELRAVCRANDARFITISLPNRPYGCADCAGQLQQVGYTVQHCHALDADAAFGWAAQSAEVAHIAVGAHMTLAPSMFYPLDGHWNAYGNRIFAQTLIQQLNTDTLWNSFLTSGNF